METIELAKHFGHAQLRNHQIHPYSCAIAAYAYDMVRKLIKVGVRDFCPGELQPREIEIALLHGARDWKQASEDGAYLTSDYEIALRLCNDEELKEYGYFEHGSSSLKQPSEGETWLDAQATALSAACRSIIREVRKYHGLDD